MSDIVVPSNPQDLKKLKDGIEELTNSMTRVDGEKDFQKEAIENLSEESGIDKKHIRRMAVDSHKDQFKKKANEFDEYASLYESVMES